MRAPFADRTDAGHQLASALVGRVQGPVVVLGLPRGGVAVAREVARALGAPLDVILVRKLGVPFQPELAMGAVGEDGVRVVSDEVVQAAGITPGELAEVERGERRELARRARAFRRSGDRNRVPLAGRTAVVVDDGVATGATARAACEVARAHGAARVVLAVPVAPRGWERRMAGAADELVCLATPEPFRAIGEFYGDFSQATDEEVVSWLADGAPLPSPAGAGPVDLEVVVATGGARLAGSLKIPAGARGVVVFAHGSGSSRKSPRNRMVAEVLNQAGLGTLVFDLLTLAEAAERAKVFDVGLLASRLVGATRWLRRQPEAADRAVAYFGASTGAAAVLWAAAAGEEEIFAVVSRGGRPDLATPVLGMVTAPTLLIVGGDDLTVLDLNRHSLKRLTCCEHRLEVIPGADHLFTEPGALEAVASLAADWYRSHLPPPTPGAAAADGRGDA